MLPKYSKRIFLVMLSMLAYTVLSQAAWINRKTGFIPFFFKQKFPNIFLAALAHWVL